MAWTVFFKEVFQSILIYQLLAMVALKTACSKIVDILKKFLFGRCTSKEMGTGVMAYSYEKKRWKGA